MYDFHTRPRNFCSLCTPMEKYPGYGYALVEICGYCTGITQVITGQYPYPTLVCVACTTSIPVPGTSVRSVHQWRNIHTRPRNFCSLCTPMEKYPGYGYALVELPECGYGYYPGHYRAIPVPDTCVRSACTTSIPVPGTSVRSVHRWRNTGGRVCPCRITRVRVRVLVRVAHLEPYPILS